MATETIVGGTALWGLVAASEAENIIAYEPSEGKYNFIIDLFINLSQPLKARYRVTGAFLNKL